MTKFEVGQRVGAICSGDAEGNVEFFGYGVYDGDHVPDTDEIRFMGISLMELGIQNPKIILDSGDVVWGAECWWAAEALIQDKMMLAKTVTTVTPAEIRARYAQVD